MFSLTRPPPQEEEEKMYNNQEIEGGLLLRLMYKQEISGRKLAALRERAHMTIRDLAYALDVSTATISRAENSETVRPVLALACLYVFEKQAARAREVAAAQAASVPSDLAGPVKRPRGRPRKTSPAMSASPQQSRKGPENGGDNNAS
jgi:DNA-binding XRE family transcriptional regulator